MDRKTRVLIVVSSLMALVLVVSNIAAVKLWDLCGIPVDGGLIIFPLSYILGDLAVELYGEKTAGWIVFLVAALNILTMLIFAVVIALPPYPGWDGQGALEATLGSSIRITVASLTAFIASSLSNNWLFCRIKIRQASSEFRPAEDYDRGYRLRAILSSLLGRFIDNALFETIGFLGVLPTKDFIKQAIGAYVEGTVVETVLVIFVSGFVVSAIKRYIRKEAPA